MALPKPEGAIPIQYQEKCYRIPWLPEKFRVEPPLVYVNPTQDMISTNVIPVLTLPGLVSHSYLKDWQHSSSTLVHLVNNLRDAFGKDCPLFTTRRGPGRPDSNLESTLVHILSFMLCLIALVSTISRLAVYTSGIWRVVAICGGKLADKTARVGGFHVVVPDFFYGDPFIPEKTERLVWLQSHRTDKGFEDAIVIIAALRNKGISTIGAAGFCWGGKVVVELSKSDCIQAAVLLHPSRVTIDDIKEVKAPIAILGAEFDKISPPELLKQFEEVLSTKPDVSGNVKIFPGVPHGWAVRYKDEDETAVKLVNEAHQDMLDWFTKYMQ
ncbi:hypothetical protein ACLB2K_019498 [Fragaria x ananassa]